MKKVYTVIKHEISGWKYTRIEDYEETATCMCVCTTIDLAVKEANRVAKEVLDDFKAIDGDDFDGWNYDERVIERELCKEEMLSTPYNKKICWFYKTVTDDYGYGVEIRETIFVEESQ